MKKRYGLVLSLIILGLMFFVLRDINFVEVWELLNKMDATWFWLSFSLVGLMFVFWTFRFRNTLGNLVNRGMSFFYLSAILLAGVFVNTITPGSNVGGEPVRAYFLSKKFKKTKTRFLGIIIADKFFNILAFSLFLVFSILFVLIFIDIPFILKIIFEGFLIGIFLIIVFVVFFNYRKTHFDFGWVLRRLYWFKITKRKFGRFEDFENYSLKKLKHFSGVFRKGVFNRRVFLWGVSLSVLIWVLNFLSSYFLFFAFGERVSFLSVIIVVTLSYAIGDLSPVPGGVGLVESSMFLLYSAMGVTGSLAITVSLLSRMIYYFYAIVVGGLSLIYLKLSVK